MALDIFDALEKGLERTFAKSGLMIAGLLFISSFLSGILSATMAQGFGSAETINSATTALTLPIPPIAAGLLLIPVAIFSAIVGIVAIRTFVSDETETIPEEFYKRNLLMALLNMIVGGIVFAIIVVAGLIAFVIPGIFLLVSLYFWTVFVVVEDQNFIEGMKNSWNLTKGNRFRLFALGVFVFIATMVVNALFSVPDMLGLTVVGLITSQIAGALTAAFNSATLAQAYNQLK